jgi:hypothetical protein
MLLATVFRIRRLHWGRHFAAEYGNHMNPCDEGFYKYWFGGALAAVFTG